MHLFKKVQASGKAYSNIMALLPKEFHRVLVQDLPLGKFYPRPHQLLGMLCNVSGFIFIAI